MKKRHLLTLGCSTLVLALASAGPAGAIELGNSPDDGNSGASNSLAIGNGWTQISPGNVTSVAVGVGAKVRNTGNGGGGTSVGYDAWIGLTKSQQTGTNDTSRSTAIGGNTRVFDGAYSSTAVGFAASVGEFAHESTALGQGANVGDNSVGAVAVGHGAAVSAGTNYGIAIGDYAKAYHVNSVAIGFNSQTTRGAESGYTAYGLSAAQTSIGEVTIGTPSGQRTLTGVAAGHDAHDAVNVEQLDAVATNTTAMFGGGASVDSNGAFTAPTYTIQGGNYSDVGSAFSAVDGALTDLGMRISQEAGQAGAVGLAASSLRFDDRPGKFSLGMGAGRWGGENAFAFGAGYTTDDQRVHTSLTGSTSGGRWGVSGGVTFTLN